MATNNIEHLKGKISLSRTIRQEKAGIMRQALDDYRAKVSEINNDHNLSAAGKQVYISSIKEEYEEDVLKLSQSLKKKEQDALDDAKAGARKVLLTDLPKVDTQQEKLFQNRANDLQARATFATSSAELFGSIRELSELAANDPKLSEDIKPTILQLSEKVLAITDKNDIVQTKKALFQIYEITSDNALPIGGKEAREIIETADAIEQEPMFVGTIPDAMKEISEKTARYLDSPNEYFEQQDEQGDGQ